MTQQSRITADQTERLGLAIAGHDYTLAAEIARSIASAIDAGEPISAEDRLTTLNLLRKKRIFGPLIGLARALIAAGKADARVKRQLAQALIEHGEFAEAEHLLRALAQDPDTSSEERFEAIGLLGRAAKQRYVDGAYAPGEARSVLLQALEAYLHGYLLHPTQNYWHGINAVSLLQRAERDQVPLPSLADSEELSGGFQEMARKMLRTIEETSDQSAWQMATAAEACIALNRFDAALAWIGRYTAQEDADVFELSSTIRQFVQVLELDERAEGAPLLERLRDENLKRSGGGFISEMLEAANSERERSGREIREPVRVPVLLRVSDPSWQSEHIPDLIVTSRLGTVIAALGSQRSIDAALVDSRVVGLEASRPGGALESTATAAGVGLERVPAELGVSGRDVLIAIIDGGVDILHQAFLDENGKSRIIAYWDQADPTGPEPLPNCGGTLHDAEAIAGYVATQELPPGIRDDNLVHGTHIASIAAGRACGNFSGGVAPNAKIVIVRGKTTVDPRDPQAVGYSLAHANALTFIDRLATARNLPVVVNVSQGQNAGAHDGTSLLELAFDEFARGGREPGRVVVKSAGNERDKNAHAKLTLQPSGKEKLRLAVPPRAEPLFLEVWFRPSSVLKFQLTSPTGQSSLVASFEKLEVPGTLANGNEYKLSYDRFHQDNGHNRLRIFIKRGSAAEIETGEWQLTITSGDRVDGDIHAWIERGLEPEASFLNHFDEEMTLSIPGTARTVITVAAVSIDSLGIREVGSFSSYGGTRDGREKPDICAPGVAVSAAKALTQSDVMTLSGTSMAAPCVTGAVALLLSLKPKLNAAQILNLLQFTADPGRKFDRGQGYGLLDAAKFLEEGSKL